MAQRHRIELFGLQHDPVLTRGVVSLPLPRGGPWRVAGEGVEVCASTVGVWPRSESQPGGPRQPRRALVHMSANQPLPERLALTLEQADSDTPPAGDPGWSVRARLLADLTQRRDEAHTHYCKETYELVLQHHDREVALRPAIDNAWGMHDWQYVVVEPLWSSPTCAAWVAGGHIFCGYDSRVPVDRMAYEFRESPHPPNETVHASLYIVAFADGTVELTCHFVNGRVYHGIGPVYGRPVLLFRDLAPAVASDGRAWDGSDARLAHEGVLLDLSPAAHFVSSEHPGKVERHADDLCWQPFENTRVDLRTRPSADGKVHEDVVHGSEKGLVQGAARSVSFGLSLSGATPRAQRYLASPSWYAELEEMAPMPLEHTSGPYTEIAAMGCEAFLDNAVSGRFTAGGIYRYLYQHGLGTCELSMDGNECRSLYRHAYWRPDARVYELAQRNAYFCADLAVDHAVDAVHYHGDTGEWKTNSLIYQRFSGLVLGYLETGDRYLLQTAQAVARHYINTHVQNWPRQGMGRDLDPLAGFCILYDYSGDEHWLSFARDVAGHVTQVIRDGGVWLSGAGVGPYWGINALEGSAWNGGHFFNGFTEYVMRAEAIPPEWIEPARRALGKLLRDLWDNEHHYHPASCGFLPRTHWYLACRLKDPELIELVNKLMAHLLVYKDNPTDEPMFRGGKAHHMNNYLDYLMFYEATRKTLPEQLG